MEKHFELNDEAFEKQFETASLDPNIFSHEAHLRLAWIYIHKYGIDLAIQKVVAQLSNYVAFLGQNDKFNKTLTIAALKAVDHFIRKSTADNFPDFIAEFPRLKNNFSALIAAHYQVDIFNSEKAKREYIEPDLLPFD